jgi:hypothetical protein
MIHRSPCGSKATRTRCSGANSHSARAYSCTSNSRRASPATSFATRSADAVSQSTRPWPNWSGGAPSGAMATAGSQRLRARWRGNHEPSHHLVPHPRPDFVPSNFDAPRPETSSTPRPPLSCNDLHADDPPPRPVSPSIPYSGTDDGRHGEVHRDRAERHCTATGSPRQTRFRAFVLGCTGSAHDFRVIAALLTLSLTLRALSRCDALWTSRLVSASTAMEGRA